MVTPLSNNIPIVLLYSSCIIAFITNLSDKSFSILSIIVLISSFVISPIILLSSARCDLFLR